MPLEQFSDVAFGVVTSGGTTAPASGTSQSWTVTTTSANAFPGALSAAVPPTIFHVADTALPSETVAVTNVSGTTWTVTRGVDGTVPVAHTTGFTIYQVVNAGVLGMPPQWYNVRSVTYGAKGDGATDDTTAIQAALTACGTGGGIVYLPAGAYLISQTLQFSSNTTMCGDGMQVTTIRAKNSFAATQVGSVPGMVMLTSAGGTAKSNIKVTGLTVDGNLSNIATLPSYATSNQVLCSPVNFWMVDNLCIEEIEVINPIGYGVFTVGCTHFTISRNRVITGQVFVNGYIQQDALHTSSCQYGVIHGNLLNTGSLNNAGQNVGDDGICIQGIGALGPWGGGPCNDITVTGNVVEACAARGFSLVLGGNIVYNITITGNDFTHIQHEGGVFEYGVTGSGSPYIISNITITGNTFSNIALSGSGRGITLDDITNIQTSPGGAGWADVAIIGNTFTTFANTGGVGIYAQQGSGLQIIGNIFDNWNAGTGIQMGDNNGTVSNIVTNFEITGNTINLSAATLAGTDGIAIVDSHDGTITGNTIRGNGNASSIGINPIGVSATNLVTGIAVTGNRVVAWGTGIKESASPTQPNFNLYTVNNLHGNTTAIAGSGFGANDITTGNLTA